MAQTSTCQDCNGFGWRLRLPRDRATYKRSVYPHPYPNGPLRVDLMLRGHQVTAYPPETCRSCNGSGTTLGGK